MENMCSVTVQVRIKDERKRKESDLGHGRGKLYVPGVKPPTLITNILYQSLKRPVYRGTSMWHRDGGLASDRNHLLPTA